MVDWSDPETLWLNITNAALGAVVLILLLVIIGAAGREIWARLLVILSGAGREIWEHRRLRSRSQSSTDDHTRVTADLGITMADGGHREGEEPEEEDAPGA